VELLKDDGFLSVMTSFHSDNIEELKSWYYANDPSHVSFYSLKTFEKIAKNVGLEIIYINNKNYITFRKRNNTI
jgi:antirestriction protein ArdC